MTLTANALTALSALNGPGPHALAAQHDGLDLTCELSNLDALACSFSHLTLATAALAGASTADLQRISDDLSKRLTYLLEPISPIETDVDGCVVQMRSNPPQQDDDGTQYYELLVRRGGSLSLRRWKKEPATGSRAAIDANVTREVFGRLIADMAAVVSP